MGAWISYGLGSLVDNLPSFVVLPDPRGLPYNGKGNFSSGFLPMTHQGTILDASSPTPVPDLFLPGSPSAADATEREGLRLLARQNRRHAEARPGDSRLDARIASYELAAKMQLAAPEALDLKGETAATRALYGLDEAPTEDFGRRCLLARRLVGRGVRFVQVWSGAGGSVQQLGQSLEHPEGATGNRAERRPSHRGPAPGSEGQGPPRRHARDLQHRVRPDAVHPGGDRARPQRRNLGRLARRGRDQGRGRARVERPLGLEGSRGEDDRLRPPRRRSSA